MNSYIDTGERWYCENVCLWFDNTFRPARGHHGNCKWFFDGQITYHLPVKKPEQE